MNVWTYWEGPRYPYLDICFRRFREVFAPPGIFTFHLVTPETLYDFIPNDVLHKNFHQLTQPGVRADAIRAALLAEHGGWWFDADTLMLRPPYIFTPETNHNQMVFLTWTKKPRRVLNGYIYATGQMAHRWLEEVNRALAQGKSEWLHLGEAVLTPLTEQYPSLCTEVARKLFLPVDIDSDPTAFFQKQNPYDYQTHLTICWGFNHSWFLYHHPDETKSSRWTNILFHRVIAGAAE